MIVDRCPYCGNEREWLYEGHGEAETICGKCYRAYIICTDITVSTWTMEQDEMQKDMGTNPK